MNNLKEIYHEMIKEVKEINASLDMDTNTPTLIDEIFKPDSTVCVNNFFNKKFSIDEKGMEEIIDLYDQFNSSLSEKEKRDLIVILQGISDIIDKYLGGKGIQNLRIEKYIDCKNKSLTLSEIKDQGIGLCAERALTAFQLLKLLEKKGQIKNYSPILTLSCLKLDDGNFNPHVFIVLKSKNKDLNSFLFDIENPTPLEDTKKGEIYLFLGLYVINDKDLKKLESGDNISPQNIYGQLGLINPKGAATRYYGNYKSLEKSTDKVYV